jgi:hypothetical protein
MKWKVNDCLICPSLLKSKENIEKINETVWEDRLLNFPLIAEMVNLKKETVRHMLNNDCT